MPHVLKWYLSSRASAPPGIRHGTGSLGHRVNVLFGSSFTSGSPGHHFDQVWDPSFPGFRKMPKMQNVHLKCGYNYSYLLTDLPYRVLEYSIRYSTEYSSSKKLDSHTPTHKSTFGVHYRTASPHGRILMVNWVSGSLDSRVTGSLGHKIWPSSMYDIYRNLSALISAI